MWVLLNNKALTWDILQKQSFKGPSRCCLCEADLETNFRLTVSWPYSKQVWKEIEGPMGLHNTWEGVAIKQCSRRWCQNKDTTYKSLLISYAWGIWVARNAKLFEGVDTHPLKYATQSLNILYFFPSNLFLFSSQFSFNKSHKQTNP
jgi:hypothetical protein